MKIFYTSFLLLRKRELRISALHSNFALTCMSRSSSTSSGRPFNKKSTNVVTIRASEIAAIIGLNPFKKPSEIFDEMWKRTSPETFVGQTKADIVEVATLSCTVEEKKVLTSAESYVAVDAADAIAKFKEVEKIIQKSTNLSEEKKVVILEKAKSKLNTEHGIRAESKTAILIEKKEGILLKTDDKFYKQTVCIIDDKTYQINGKIDRIEDIDGELVIVEIKNRMKRLFLLVPEYENIQIQAYLQIVPLNIQRVKFIEHYLKETNTIIVERDDALWKNDIFPELVKFCTKLHNEMKVAAANIKN